jgi:hypothetical protein
MKGYAQMRGGPNLYPKYRAPPASFECERRRPSCEYWLNRSSTRTEETNMVKVADCKRERKEALQVPRERQTERGIMVAHLVVAASGSMATLFSLVHLRPANDFVFLRSCCVPSRSALCKEDQQNNISQSAPSNRPQGPACNAELK